MSAFEKSVFINCLFDNTYRPLLRPLLFTILYLEFTPRIALESLDSGKPRIDKIITLIRSCRYVIHDLSRLQAQEVGEYFRLNMPFELGIDVGCRLFRGGKWSTKKCLILEAEKYRYQAALSDLSNSDIAVHRNEPIEVLYQVRNWLNNQAKLKANGPAEIWGRFTDFMAYNFDALKQRGFSDRDIENLPVDELIESMTDWVRKFKSRPSA
jgi:hypothetical protein